MLFVVCNGHLRKLFDAFQEDANLSANHSKISQTVIAHHGVQCDALFAGAGGIAKRDVI